MHEKVCPFGIEHSENPVRVDVILMSSYSKMGHVVSKTTYQHMIKNIFTLKPWPKIGKTIAYYHAKLKDIK